MTQHKYSIFAICLLALGLTMSGCTEGNNVEEAQAEVAAAQAELEAAKQAQGKQSEVDAAQAELKAAKQELRAERAKPAAREQPQVCGDCGTITSITARKTQGSNTSKGAIAGGVIGAVAGVVAGNQIGSGSGKDIARVVGGIGGAAAGQQIGKRIDTDTYYAVTVNMDAGGSRSINVPDDAGLAVGQDVRVQGGNIVLQ